MKICAIRIGKLLLDELLGCCVVAGNQNCHASVGQQLQVGVIVCLQQEMCRFVQTGLAKCCWASLSGGAVLYKDTATAMPVLGGNCR